MSDAARGSNARLRAVTLACVALLLGCAPARPPSRAPADPSTRAIELEVIRLTNEYRRAHALPTLREDPGLAELARGHSRDMAGDGGSIDHHGVRGRFRVAAAELALAKFAENVAKTVPDPKVPSARRVLSGWAGSATHRANLEGPFVLVGVGVVRHPSGALYFTQILAAVRDAPRSVPASLERRAR